MTRKKAKIITMIVCIIISILIWMYMTYNVGWYITPFSVGVSILGISVLVFCCYSFAYLLWISNLTDDEEDGKD